MARRRGERIPLHVKFKNGGVEIDYGFLSNIPGTYHEELGIVKWISAQGVVFGANAPKPGRARKDFLSASNPEGTSQQANSISCFFSEDKRSALKTAGWDLTGATKTRGLKQTGKTRTVYVGMPGGRKYAWNLTVDELAYIDILGIKLATANDAPGLIFGSDPKPPRASKLINGERHSTFCEPRIATIDKAIADGWSIAEYGGKYQYNLIGEAP